MTGVHAENWRFGASAAITATYTDNVNYAPQGQAASDFVSSLSAAANVRGEGARVKLNGSVGATVNLYAKEDRNNSIAPNVSLFGSVEAIEKFFFIDASANLSTSFLSPFGPQPASIVNATSNRYTSQSYSVSPYIKGVLGASTISYQVRDDNYWTLASSFGDSTNQVPTTYANLFSASLNYAPRPVGWNLEYSRSTYDNGLATGNSVIQIARLVVPYQIDPQFQVSGRVGYEDASFPEVRARETQSTIYGAGFQWSPTDRTQMGGFWEHQFFGSSYAWQISHRLPNAAVSANLTRGLSSYPQLALAIPAGTTVTQFLDAAFTTRIPDPAERALAIEQFLARTGLPPTLAAPVNFYGTTLTLQDAQNVSLVLIGIRNSVTFTLFNVKSEAIAGTGEVLPPALQFGQNNTQTGVGVGYSYQLSGMTGLSANASYSRTRTNDTALNDFRSNNGNLGVTMNTRFGPKTSGSAGMTYSLFTSSGDSDTPSTDSITVFVTVSHTF